MPRSLVSLFSRCHLVFFWVPQASTVHCFCCLQGFVCLQTHAYVCIYVCIYTYVWLGCINYRYQTSKFDSWFMGRVCLKTDTTRDIETQCIVNCRVPLGPIPPGWSSWNPQGKPVVQTCKSLATSTQDIQTSGFNLLQIWGFP